MEKKAKWFVLTVLIIVSFIAIINATMIVKNPLRKTNEQIKNMILEIFPKSSEMDYIVEKIQLDYKNWTVRAMSNERGYGVDSKGAPTEDGIIRVGDKYIRVHLGRYFSPFETNVVVYFAFDGNSKLIEVSVRKDTDSF